MQDKILLIVRLIVETSHTDINEAIKEVETQTILQIPSTENVEVLKTEILKTHQDN
jgi:vacuolar-type H+-ATPase subunit F/Vma7